MSELYLCTGEISAMPYYLDVAGLNIYSLEEMSFFLKENIELIDESFMSEELVEWISKEIGNNILAKKETGAIENNRFYEFVENILFAGNILSKEEINECMSLMKQYQNRDSFERRKYKADGYVKKELYPAAIREYEKLLEENGIRKHKKEFLSEIYNNLGCAYAGMFQFKAAYEYFLKAYELGGNEKMRLHALRSKSFFDAETELDLKGREISKSYENKACDIIGEYNDKTELISELKEDYRKLLG
ncbi:MAG: hypothetical protein K6E13_05330 [Lachnospiraceae bacterium]|nr:hypothetical protein [Lachnospiraceae bacterium]